MINSLLDAYFEIKTTNTDFFNFKIKLTIYLLTNRVNINGISSDPKLKSENLLKQTTYKCNIKAHFCCELACELVNYFLII